MTAAVAQRHGSYIDRPSPSSLADVVELILDKGLVIDAFVRVSLIGIEILTIDARIVIASVDTYLRFAEAVNRIDLKESDDSQGLPELVEGMTSGGAQSKTKGALEGIKDALSGDDDDGGDDDKDKEKSSSSSRRRSSSSRSSSRSRKSS
jgi:hypothetical protein